MRTVNSPSHNQINIVESDNAVDVWSNDVAQSNDFVNQASGINENTPIKVTGACDWFDVPCHAQSAFTHARDVLSQIAVETSQTASQVVDDTLDTWEHGVETASDWFEDNVIDPVVETGGSIQAGIDEAGKAIGEFGKNVNPFLLGGGIGFAVAVGLGIYLWSKK